jgi:hypothetical protein
MKYCTDPARFIAQERAEEVERELFRNLQWVVTTEGIDTLAGDYWIDIARVTEEDWLDHMAGKNWVDLGAFCEAWLVALVYRGAKIENIGELITQAKATRLENDRKDAIRAELFPGKTEWTHNELMEDPDPVDVEYQRRYGPSEGV